MRSQVLGTMSTQHGLITREQAMAAGMTAEEIQRLVRSGRWVIVRRGVYADADLVTSVKNLGEKQRLADRAACLRITVPFVRSHDTAALEIGLGLLLPPHRMTHVTRPCVGTHNSHGIKHHLAPYNEKDVIEANGLRVLGLARTAIDIAREHGSPYGEVAIDRARWHGVTVTELENVIDAMHCWPDHRRAVTCLEQSSDGAEAVSETLMRLLIIEAGLGPVVTQFGMRDGRREAWADARVGRQLYEMDGELKYLRPDANRRTQTPAEVVVEEKNREDWFRGFRLGMTRYVWADVWGPGRAAAAVRTRREYEATTALWGTDVSDLAPYVINDRRRAA